MGAKPHQGSRNNLFGKEATPEQVEPFANEKQATAKTPPAFPARLLDSGFDLHFPTWPAAARDLCTRWQAARTR